MHVQDFSPTNSCSKAGDYSKKLWGKGRKVLLAEWNLWHREFFKISRCASSFARMTSSVLF